MVGPDIPHSDLTYNIIGCAMDIHTQLGPGLREGTYHRALAAALDARGIAVEAQKRISVTYEGQSIGELFLDLLVAGVVIVEVKAVARPTNNEDLTQVISYLTTTGLPVGLLINFGRRRLEYRRILPPRRGRLRGPS